MASATLSATCTVPGRYDGLPAHGTVPSSAQSTFTVAGSSWNRSIPRRVDGGTSSCLSSRP